MQICGAFYIEFTVIRMYIASAMSLLSDIQLRLIARHWATQGAGCIKPGSLAPSCG